jgi:ATP-dependent Clp protease ATP-binding subunit ClpC
MFERFAAPTRRILVEAEAEARELGHHFLDTQHLVLGMLVPDPDTNSAVRAMLLAAGLDLESAREAVAHMDERRMTAPIIGTIPFTPEAKKVLEVAYRESISRKAPEILPPHLLLALLRDRRTRACRLLDAHGVTAESVEAWMANPAPTEGQHVWTAGLGRLHVGGPSTPGARSALQAARLAAGANEPMGSQHVLLGLLAAERGLGAKVLADLGVTTEAVEAKIAELGVSGTSDGPPPARIIKVGNGVEVRIDDPELAARVSGLDAAAAGDLIRKALLEHLAREDPPSA